MKIADLPEKERPREKALALGIGALSDAELLALLLGKGTKGHSALELSYALLSEFGSLSSLSLISLPEIAKYPGIKGVKSLELIGIFELAKRLQTDAENRFVYAPISLHQYLLRKPIEKETAYVFFLDGKGTIKGEKVVGQGNADSLGLNIKDVLTPVMRSGYSRFVFVHTHPSGVAYPSASDLAFTQKLLDESQSLSLRLFDHLIHSDSDYYSFVENGLL